jgi:MoxR-like ATPase
MTLINPRQLLKEKDGKKRLYALLGNAGYVAQKIPFNAMCNALFMATPILFEGHRGGGKTAFPEGLAKALGHRLFTLPCLHDTTTDHILFSWDSAGQHHFVSQEAMKGVPLAEALEKQWSVDFLKLGEVLDAFFYSAATGDPCVLLIDEIDKLSQDAESALLQILARGFANVPQLRPDSRIGFVPEMDKTRRHLAYPIVVLTSNDLGTGVSSPLRSRGRYSFINTPTIEEMVRVLAVKVPDAGPRLLFQTAKLIHGVSGLPLVEKPALREFIMLLETFVAYGYTFLNAEIINENIDCLAKTRKDVEAAVDAVDMLFYSYVSKDDACLEELVWQIIQQRQPPLK